MASLSAGFHLGWVESESRSKEVKLEQSVKTEIRSCCTEETQLCISNLVSDNTIIPTELCEHVLAGTVVQTAQAF